MSKLKAAAFATLVFAVGMTGSTVAAPNGPSLSNETSLYCVTWPGGVTFCCEKDKCGTVVVK